jgi:hypothetical protein
LTGLLHVLAPVFELHPSRQLWVRGGAHVAIDPEDAIAELSDQQIADRIAIKIADERSSVANCGVDRLAGRLDPDRRRQFTRDSLGPVPDWSHREECQERHQLHGSLLLLHHAEYR